MPDEFKAEDSPSPFSLRRPGAVGVPRNPLLGPAPPANPLAGQSPPSGANPLALAPSPAPTPAQSAPVMQPPQQPGQPVAAAVGKAMRDQNMPPEEIARTLQRADYLVHAFATLLQKPHPTEGDVLELVTSVVKTGLIEPDQVMAFLKEVPKDPDKLRAFLEHRRAIALHIAIATRHMAAESGAVQGSAVPSQ